MTENHDIAESTELDEAAVQTWRTRAEERRSSRKRSGVAGLIDSFMEWPAWQRWAFAVPAVLLLLTLLAVTIDLVASAGRIHPGIVAAGVEIGGLSEDDAAAKLSRTLPARMADPVVVSFETTSWNLDAAQLKASPDTTATAEKAFTIGRSGGFLELVAIRAASWFSPLELEVPVTSDASATTAAIDAISAEIDTPPTDATVVIRGTSASIAPAVLGRKSNTDALREDVLSAFVNDDKSVSVQVELVPVRVTDEGAKQALADTERMLSGPVTVTYDSNSWDFTPAEIAQWIDFRIAESVAASGSSSASTDAVQPNEPVSGTALLEAFISSVQASETVTRRVGKAGKPAVDATFKVSAGSVVIVPSQDGVGPDITSLAAEMTSVLKSEKARSVALLTQRVQPAITTELAKGMGIKERISTYTTTYAASNKPRVNNIHTLADALDGALIPPGGTFSFNGTIGPRTAAKGYQEAPAIVNGELVPQLGGGICQVGTTVFNTVFESGLPVVERKNHSLYISHYPKGRDATVSWGGPDFKFKNDTATWILLATGYSNSSLTVSLYGTDPGYEVSSATGPWTNIKPHAVNEIKDPTLPLGKRVTETSGADGRTILVTRTIKKNGTLVREDTFKSVYKPETEVVRVGTGPAIGTTPTTTP